MSNDLSRAALELVARHWKIGKPIRTLTITGEHLVPADSAEAESEQLSFFDVPSVLGKAVHVTSEREEKLEQMIDKIRNRYGSKAIIQGSLLGNDLGIRDKD